MQRASVKFYNADRGFGFLVPDDGGPDVFVHCRELHQSGIRKLTEGQSVEYEAGPGRNGTGPKATAVKLVTV